MKNLKRFVLGMLLFATTQTATADVLILVHGYLGSAFSWEKSGINSVLQANGWRRAGILGGPQLPPPAGGNSVYSVELPSLAPMMVQANYFQAMLRQIDTRHADEPVIVVAHSAGGVVARIVLARGGIPRAMALITISTPHLGTIRALDALDATDDSGPIGWFKDMFAGGLYQTVKHSWGALIDLTPPTPGSLLYWLNVQPHPDIEYYSIIRTGPVGLGDELVSVFSQDMNNVPALRGRSQAIPVAAGHALHPQDGVVLVDLLSSMN